MFRRNRPEASRPFKASAAKASTDAFRFIKRKPPSRGRHSPKFPEPCIKMTYTLLDRTLHALQDMDADSAKAIVRCVGTVLAAVPWQR